VEAIGGVYKTGQMKFKVSHLHAYHTFRLPSFVLTYTYYLAQTLEVLTNVATISAAEAEDNSAFSDFISKELVAKGLLPKVMNKLGVGSVVYSSYKFAHIHT
jgi:hypothetical protein